eukprot:c13535_g1_i1.p2 GENE.c13535_g1_i1~~c13535_g1_i1.p2  ORF type:complete len:240 (+),score=89.88 c13535_g1_i1:55-774(+)
MSSTNQEEKLKKIVTKLSRSTSTEQILDQLSKINNLTNHLVKNFSENSSILASNGAIEAILQTFSSQESALQNYMFRTIGVMCFGNKDVSLRTCESDKFHLLTDSIKSHPDACYALNNIAAFCWEAHPRLLNCVPEVLEVFSLSKTASLQHKTWCVRFCGQLAYNISNRENLMKTDIIQMFLDSIASQNIEMGCCTAAAALACLAGSDSLNLNANQPKKSKKRKCEKREKKKCLSKKEK